MNRRDALKKLGVGGAIALTAPVILDGFNVAHASSTANPPPDEIVTSTSVTPGANGEVVIAMDVDNFPPMTTFTWDTSQLPNNVVLSQNSDGSFAVVDKTSGNSPTPSFTVFVTASSVIGGDTTYRIDYNSGTNQLTVT